jgi:hypothetical protein
MQVLNIHSPCMLIDGSETKREDIPSEEVPYQHNRACIPVSGIQFMMSGSGWIVRVPVQQQNNLDLLERPTHRNHIMMVPMV